MALPVEIVPFCWKFTAERLRRVMEGYGCEAKLRLPGVVEHGMFLDMASTVIIAGELGVKIKNKHSSY
ncbi:hypothetical protein Bca52824_068788 [Brassica carinata]|uniref:Uncharacterized protein n=1 Tax=Brassica carinata TaxID=52824 RepID=A0A8X7Q0M7_BRACI|nr:hypothetical protein Bca52824_068788 [Brassica carinata]